MLVGAVQGACAFVLDDMDMTKVDFVISQLTDDLNQTLGSFKLK
jgi:hypothetical protein